jgi:pyruvate/oxaloacetate carboxyltransferase
MPVSLLLVPGGILTNMEVQLKEQGAKHPMDVVLK